MSGASVPLPGVPVDVCFEPVCDGGNGESHVVVRTSAGGVYIVAVRWVWGCCDGRLAWTCSSLPLMCAISACPPPSMLVEVPVSAVG
jgi:hypothetical protein